LLEINFKTRNADIMVFEINPKRITVLNLLETFMLPGLERN
jgi:hypothetical protein